mmetsp:Transcript_28778/g.37793  ORF Transcript_28778/g.37793 Transcript_28778/m.37793 type:complete len:270 (-) Transcript_28778:71-880(-)
MIMEEKQDLNNQTDSQKRIGVISENISSWNQIQSKLAEIDDFSQESFASYTARMSRVYSIFSAIQKLNLQMAEERRCIIHIIGADQNEGNDLQETTHLFMPLYHLILQRGYQALSLFLIGPNIPAGLTGNLYTNVQGLHFNVLYSCEEYHEYWQSCVNEDQSRLFQNPIAAFCFNAGVWGYDSWEPTLKFLIFQMKCPTIITSYNELEAEDDEEAIETMFQEANHDGTFQWHWKAELNPFCSQLHRPSQSFEGRILIENHHWQCFGPVT